MQPALFTASEALLNVIKMDDSNAGWLEGYIRWELGLLAAVGYQLDLSRCAVTGRGQGLAYVSPRSGRAVTGHAAGDYVSRMLALPQFLGGVHCPKHDWVAGLDLTAFFGNAGVCHL